MLNLPVARSLCLLTAALALSGVAAAQTLSTAKTAALAAASASPTAASPSRMPTAGPVRVAVRLTDPPLALAVGVNARKFGSTMSLAQRQAYMAMLKQKQDALMAQIRKLGGVEEARVSKAYNALMISTDATRLPQIARLAGVSAIHRMVDFRLALGTTVPYVGASALQALGLTGAGVKIAILDSGVDYTHRNLGGSGLAADFAAASANATTLSAGLFPTAKVIGGYDFVGEGWPGTAAAPAARAPDPNPIDAGIGSGHGTHVADIAAGASTDGLHKGVAPGAKIYAVKVCSSVSTSCSNEAILQGLDWAMDPNGDLDFSDAADVVNMSLGTNYGLREDPATEAVSNLVRFGIVVAVAAGNAGDRPYIVSSPSSASEAISVAQTAMPSESVFPLRINAPAAIAGLYSNTATVDWAPVNSAVTQQVVAVGRGCPAGSAGAGSPDDVYVDNPAGKIALIDRGACSVSLKVDRAARAGAVGVLIGLVASGDAVTFGFGGGSSFVPTLVIQQSLSSAIKANLGLGVNATLSPTNAIALVGSMAGSSARGPSINFSMIKPEIGAPGASVSALNGTGNAETGFGGTSGATPMVAGAAALLLQKYPNAVPAEVKSRLMNSANTAVYTNPTTAPGELAPISRIGAGELRVDRAAGLTTGVWDATNPFNVGLSFGSVRVAANTTLVKKIAVRNYSSAARTYTITRSFRYANDQASGAVTLSAPATITVPANGTAAFSLTLTIDASKLPDWFALSSGGSQGTGALLQPMEFDGYVRVADGTDGASVPWHILPHKSANVTPQSTQLALSGASAGSLTLSNLNAAVAGVTDVFALTGTSPQASATLPAYGGGYAMIDLKAVGVRLVEGQYLQFGITTFGDRAHPAYPAEYDVYVDVDNDGFDDFVIYNAENGGFGATGQTVVVLLSLANGSTTIKYYADADLNSSNMIYTVDLADLGLAPNKKFRFSVYAFDDYLSGFLTDAIENMRVTLNTPAYSLGEVITLPAGLPPSGVPFTKVPGGATASPSQTGFLLLHRDARSGREADLITITP
jgi:subtilisin family serine protease